MTKQKIWSRKATESDSSLLLLWRNDPVVRKNSFNSNPITSEEHSEWLKKCLASVDVEIYLYFIDEEPLGQVRLNYEKDVAIISYSIAEPYRGFGFGREIIRDVELLTQRNHPETKYFIGNVKIDNIASQKIFEDNQFELQAQFDGYYTYRKSLVNENIAVTRLTQTNVNRGGGGINVLFLTNNRNSLQLFEKLSRSGETVYLWSDVLSIHQVTSLNPSIIVSYNYQHLIPQNIITAMDGRVVNLHISYLPWNKGSDPNFWSFIDGTPKGVTIHKVDTHLDTGDIIAQREIFFDETRETFRTSYDRLHQEIQELFLENWESIKQNTYSPKKQCSEGSYHKHSEFEQIQKEIPIDWDEVIVSYKQKFTRKIYDRNSCGRK